MYGNESGWDIPSIALAHTNVQCSRKLARIHGRTYVYMYVLSMRLASFVGDSSHTLRLDRLLVTLCDNLVLRRILQDIASHFQGSF